jgi:hypothetical protein
VAILQDYWVVENVREENVSMASKQRIPMVWVIKAFLLAGEYESGRIAGHPVRHCSRYKVSRDWREPPRIQAGKRNSCQIAPALQSILPAKQNKRVSGKLIHQALCSVQAIRVAYHIIFEHQATFSAGLQELLKNLHMGKGAAHLAPRQLFLVWITPGTRTRFK